MAILFVTDFNREPHLWTSELNRRLPAEKVAVLGDAVDPSAVEVVITDTPLVNHGGFSQFPRLQWVHYLGHGVGDVLMDSTLPSNIPVTRMRRASMARSISIYVINAVTGFHLNLRQRRQQQINKQWQPVASSAPSGVVVAVLGLGIIGCEIATQLTALGYRVMGWSRTEKDPGSFATRAGVSVLADLLAEADVIVAALPETRDTVALLNKQTFALMKDGVFIVNIGRGSLIVEHDLLEALDQGKVEGAALDVFATEPLPAEHPFWSHGKVDVSPHIGGVGKDDQQQVFDEIAENCRRFRAGESLINLADRSLGY